MKGVVPAALAVSLVATGGALADPAGKSTLEETIRPGTGTGFSDLSRARGERYMVRRLGARADRDRDESRRSLVFFGQLTDPQIADEMSPARVDFLDPAGGPALTSSHRAQEAIMLQTFDQIVRNLNANRRSPVEQGNGRQARLNFAVTTGDLADSQQENESRWFIDVLDGGRIDPMSGKPVGPNNPCPGASSAEVSALNADVAARRYTGVQDYGRYPGQPSERYGGFWDPDAAPPGATMYDGFPRYPGLLDRAQQPFRAAGLDVPWFTARGNHDGLIGGTIPAVNPIFRAVVTGCVKVFPDASIDPSVFAGVRGNIEFFRRLGGDPAFVNQLLSIARRVPPDPDRRFVNKAEYKSMHGRSDRGHGFRNVDRSEQRRSDGSASYYAYSPKRGFRFIAIDTVAEGGGSSGNLDDPQYRWLERELKRASERDQLIFVYAHHTLATMNNTTRDEAAGRCPTDTDPGCDQDPRRSTPIHRGLQGRQNLRSLLLRHPHVIAFVNGHTHNNAVTPFSRRGRGFWEINTASHTDFPQQSRLIEVMDNRDGTLSLFGTILDQASPIEPPAPGPASAFNTAQLGSISRLIAFNDPQRRSATGETGDSGERRDRNVELLVRDPRE